MSSALASRAGLLTCGYYAALFLAVGAHLPYWPVWLKAWGLGDGEIGTYLGAALAVRLVANAAMSAVADAHAVRRLMLGICGFVAATVFALHALAESRPVLFVLTLMVTMSLSPMIPLGEALGLRAAIRHGFPYPQARAVGSAAFLVMNLGLGVAIAHVGPDAALWSLVVCCALAAVFGLMHPGGGAPPGGGLDTAGLREGWQLTASPAFLAFVVAASAGLASHAVFYSYGSLVWAAQGIGAEVIGQLWAMGVAVEVALMLGPGARLVVRLGPARALAIGAAAGILRWGMLSAEPALWALWPLQALHALTFALAHLGAMAFIASAIPPRLAATAQGVYVGTISGTVMAGATLLAGVVSGTQGMAASYWLAAGLSAVSLIAALVLIRRWDGERLMPT
ncbi:MFS transporter [Limibaculum sp. M0105]|uniref:MFS transporter n=1 Tax=Thermohalobaculum xanthum TaxID=2753746 RepID=A0A8J7M6J3_9RHOB|nr:MFS transporter [Thermohalobaculum xanthum]MBK0399269.1 MFS transporter [Thermohalobaculum xanthum]